MQSDVVRQSNKHTARSRRRKIYQVTLVGSVINAVLIAMKFAAGILGRSSAMMADAIHSLSDFVTDIIVLLFVNLSAKPSDRTHAYGHGKFETLATVIIGILLIVVGLVVFANGLTLAIRSIGGEELPRPTMLALIVAVISIVLKELVYRYTVAQGRELSSNAVVANAWHHRSDALSSIGTFVGIAGAMFFGAKWRILDPLAAIVVSLFIVKVGYGILKPGIDELLERSLPQSVEDVIETVILDVPGVKTLHNLRTRRIGNSIAIEAHVRMDGSITLERAHTIASEVERCLRERFGAGTHIGIHMEPAH